MGSGQVKSQLSMQSTQSSGLIIYASILDSTRIVDNTNRPFQITIEKSCLSESETKISFVFDLVCQIGLEHDFPIVNALFKKAYSI